MSSYSFDEYTNVKHVMYDATGDARQGLAPHHLRGAADRPQTAPVMRNRAPMTEPTPVTVSPALAAWARVPPDAAAGESAVLPSRPASPPAARPARTRRSAPRTRPPRISVANEKIVNWSNWPEYIDVDDKTKKRPPWTRSPPRPASRSTTSRTTTTTTSSSPRSSRSCRPQGHRPRRLVQHRLDGRPADPPRLGAEARQGQHPEHQRTSSRTCRTSSTTRAGLLPAVAERVHGHRLQPQVDRRQEIETIDQLLTDPASRARSPCSPRCATRSA